MQLANWLFTKIDVKREIMSMKKNFLKYNLLLKKNQIVGVMWPVTSLTALFASNLMKNQINFQVLILLRIKLVLWILLKLDQEEI